MFNIDVLELYFLLEMDYWCLKLIFYTSASLSNFNILLHHPTILKYTKAINKHAVAHTCGYQCHQTTCPMSVCPSSVGDYHDFHFVVKTSLFQYLFLYFSKIYVTYIMI